jgi:hypothetical protein
MRSRPVTLFIALLIAHCSLSLKAQEKGLWNKVKNNVGVSGGFGYSSTFYNISGATSQRPPHFWQITANLNIKAGPIDMPFSARFSPQGNDASYPTVPTQIGMSPKYKAWTFHLGWRSLKFSDFSLGGNQFVGGGVEFKPQKGIIHVKALFGRFMKSNIEYDPNLIVVGTPTYERWGGGAQIIVGKPNKNVGFHFFKAKDDPASLSGNDTLTVAPAENLVYGFTGNWALTEVVSVFGEYTISAITSDIRIEQGIQSGYSYLNNIGNIFYTNPTTSQKTAMNFGTAFNFKIANLKLGYRRVDPDYRSLGAVFLNNDLEDITGNLAFGLIQKKVNVSITGGFQRNNLALDKQTRTVRLIGALAMTYTPNEKWNLGANYSNFTTNTNQAIIREGIDTLRFAQITSATGFNITRMFKGERFTHSVLATGNYQEAVSNGDRNSQTYLAMGGYNVSFNPAKITGVVSISYNKTIAPNTETDLMGPTLGLSKSFFNNKLNTGLAGSYLNTILNKKDAGVITTVRLFAAYKLGAHHAFNASYSVVNRNLGNAVPPVNSTESIAIIAYQFTF